MKENQSNERKIPKIRVVVRKRPANQKELLHNDIDIIEKDKNTIIVKELKNKVDLTKYIEEHRFNFDKAYDENSTNHQIYEEIVSPMIDAAFNQTKITCFAYGQTGSGKTFTMMGNSNHQSNPVPGLYLLSACDVFRHLEQEEYSHLEIWVSFYEIYCNKLYDLLHDKAILQAREDGKGNICIVGLVEKKIENIQELMNIIDFGLNSRTTGVTGANMDSSRSHAIMQISLKLKSGNVYSKISFIDLAGSERAVDTIDTNKQTKIDGAEINKSLLALKECIRALDQEKRHTPFRGSKLTLVLRDSFIGNCLTLMIANISPCLSCSEHTLNTLRYADRVKELRRPKAEREAEKKDPNEALANLLMMPRQHNHTIKYTVDIRSQTPMCANNLMPQKGNEYGKAQNEIMHINQLIKGNNNIKTKNAPGSKPISKCSSNRKKSASNIRESRPFIINAVDNKISMDNQVDADKYVSKFARVKIRTEEEYQRFSEAHERLINDILKEEEEFIGSHRMYAHDLAYSVKDQMEFLNQVDKPGSDIILYTSRVDKVLKEQIEKTQQLRERLNKFRIMLKDEETLSTKLSGEEANYENDN